MISYKEDRCRVSWLSGITSLCDWVHVVMSPFVLSILALDIQEGSDHSYVRSVEVGVTKEQGGVQRPVATLLLFTNEQ